MTETASRRFELQKTALYQGFLRIWFPLFAAITVIGLIVPLKPNMPRGGLDPSWAMSMNEAAAEHMRFGHDVTFTFGPYAALYSQVYHPALDHLILIVSLIFAFCYLGALLYAARGVKPAAAIILLIFLGWFAQSRDALMFSYPLLLALCAVKFCTGDTERQRFNFKHLMFAAALCVPLGLLPLVKGNMIIVCVAMALFIVGYLLYQGRMIFGIITVIVPTLSLLFFWTLAGQPLSGLADYVRSNIQILSGYTEAMGMQGEFRGILAYLPDAEILAFLVAAGALLWNLSCAKTIGNASKIFLCACFALFLFVGFKSGFVRHDEHALVAFTCLFFAGILVGFVRWDRSVRATLLVCAVLFAGMTIRYNPKTIVVAKALIPNYKQKKEAPPQDPSEARIAAMKAKNVQPISRLVGEAVFGVYGPVWSGLRIRLLHQGELENEYRDGLAEIRDEYSIPKLVGSVDIYPTEQAYILASENIWNPRPVMQSYSAYTPKLAVDDELHLRTKRAPDHILFGLFSEDQHLPSLEDGISWTALLDNYTVTKVDQQFAYLSKRDVLQSYSHLKRLHEGVYKTGEEVALPATEGPIFARIDLESTLFGKLMKTIFKPTQVRIELQLSDGTRRDYRVVPSMMKSGFLLSPLVEDTGGFAQLVDGNGGPLRGAVVKEMAIVTYHPGWMIWKNHYTLRLDEFRGGAWGEGTGK
ncbi:MAG: hypothetical protein ABI286_04345 [Edaphobacter sp.]